VRFTIDRGPCLGLVVRQYQLAIQKPQLTETFPRLRDALIGEKTAAIQRKLRALLPQIDTEADFAWTGSFGVSDTSMPSIGLIPGKSRSYAVRAFGGNGIVFSMIAAEVLRGFLRGPPDPDADLFAFA